MLRPRDSSTKRKAKLVIRTHAVPTIASTKGSAMSAPAIIAMPTQRARGSLRKTDARPMTGKGLFMPAGLGPVADALAEQALGPEDQHQDQHDEGVHVLVVAAEEARLGAREAHVVEAGKVLVEQAYVGEVADVSGPERL